MQTLLSLKLASIMCLLIRGTYSEILNVIVKKNHVFFSCITYWCDSIETFLRLNLFEIEDFGVETSAPKRLGAKATRY